MTPADQIKTSFVVPVYRNRATLAPLCERISTAAGSAWPDEKYEVILVDDASPDGAWDEIKALAARNDFVRGVRLSSNSGQHLAVLSGFSVAQGDWVVALDGDLQDPPEAVPQMRAALSRDTGLDVVFGGRRGHYQSTRSMITSAIYRGIILRAVGLPRDAGMFFVMRRSSVQRLLLNLPESPAVTGLIAAHLASRSVPVQRAYRASGTSSYNLRRRAKAAWNVITTVCSARLASRRTSGGPESQLMNRIAETIET